MQCSGRRLSLVTFEDRGLARESSTKSGAACFSRAASTFSDGLVNAYLSVATRSMNSVSLTRSHSYQSVRQSVIGSRVAPQPHLSAVASGNISRKRQRHLMKPANTHGSGRIAFICSVVLNSAPAVPSEWHCRHATRSHLTL